jgi:hypothetical protein
MTDYAFAKKPRRMMTPPQNQRKWLTGYEGVQAVMETDPERIAYFAREASWGDLMREPSAEDMTDTLAEIATGRVLGAAFKGGYGFRIRASRSTMDQALRLAEGKGGAGSGAGAQTTRDSDMRDWNQIVPNTIQALGAPRSVDESAKRQALFDKVQELVDLQREVYGELVDAGIPPQDARYVSMPLGFQTQWMWVISLENMQKLCEQRLCNGLIQHETNYLIRVMRDQWVARHPWTDKLLRSNCEKRGECASATLMFPPCGAFINDEEVSHTDAMWPGEGERRVRLGVTQYYPAKHLYPAEQNDAMQFVKWDIERERLERERPGVCFSFVGPPRPIATKASL